MIYIIKKLEDVKEIESMKRIFFQSIENITPKEIKKNPIIDLSKKGKIKFRLNKRLIERYNLEEWLANYKKEVMVSTAGIRGVQNILYYWDTRFQIHQLGVALATLGKALVLKEKISNREIQKIASSEVRYNSKAYVELISRIQAAQGIKTHLIKDDKVTTIWMSSFLIFKHDYDGGEYVTSSHGITSKIATKDLDNQGSQFLPEISMEFVRKIEEIIQIAKKTGYNIILSEKNNPLIVNDIEGFDEYTEYLRNGVATNDLLNIINRAETNGFKIMLECVGGSIGYTMFQIFKNLKILGVFDWCNLSEDPFFHGVGKKIVDNKILDLSCDASLISVVETMGYEKILAEMPIGYVVLISDPDGDRLITAQIESKKRVKKIEELGISYIPLDEDRVLTVYTPNQSFLLTMDYYMQSLKRAKLWDNHPRFIIKTTASAGYWNTWANSNKIKVIDLPVGFKEIAGMMKKIEFQLLTNLDKDVKVHDIYGNQINLGTDPRLVFAGEESGGMITGPDELIKSLNGRMAIAMREKSAGEAAVLQTAMAAELFLKKKTFSEYFDTIFKKNRIKEMYDVREDVVFFNESEPDPEKFKIEKLKGEALRDTINEFFLTICFGYLEGLIKLDDVKGIMREACPSLYFSELLSIKFVGDGTFIRFKDKYLEIRKSGTDAKIKFYAGGSNKKDILLFVKELSKFKGEKGPLFRKHFSNDYCRAVIEKAKKFYKDFENNI
ncbi:MAG: hypothetical protein QXG00_03540 [Candidatus Woesearchaeota archaeon]